jgi:hypothetical protein
MINSKNGSLHLKSFKLLPFSKFELTNQFKSENIREVRDFNNGWKWLDIINLKINNLYFYISLGYFENRLNQILMTFKESADKSTWNDWNKEYELKNVEKFEKWLNKEIGRKRNFDWGIIDSSYDSKSGFSSIYIKYKKN